MLAAAIRAATVSERNRGDQMKSRLIGLAPRVALSRFSGFLRIDRAARNQTVAPGAVIFGVFDGRQPRGAGPSPYRYRWKRIITSLYVVTTFR